MKCLVVFVALAFVGFISADRVQDSEEIKGDGSTIGAFLTTQEQASIDVFVASYIEEITRYNSYVTSYMSYLGTSLNLISTPAKQYWIGLQAQLEPLLDLTGLWSGSNIKQKTNAYLAQYKKNLVNPIVSAFNSIAKQVAKNNTFPLGDCYNQNKYMYSQSLQMVAQNSRMNSMDPYSSMTSQTLQMAGQNVDQALQGPTMNQWNCQIQNSNNMQLNATCLLQQYTDAEAAILAAFGTFRTNVIAGWGSNIDMSLGYRTQNFQMYTSTMSSTTDMVSQCMTNWMPTPPPPSM